MKILTQTVFLIFTMHLLNAQVGIGTTNPSASALLELDSSNSGLLIPRMEESERLGIGSAANGLLVYQTDVVPGFYYYDGISSTWQLLTSKEETDKGFNTNVVLDATTLKVTDGKGTIDTDLSSLKELPTPTVNGTMNYWKDGAWIVIAPTLNEGATLQMKSGVPTWVGGTSPPAIGDLMDGGIVFWIDPMDPYKGKVCALEDLDPSNWDDAISNCENYTNTDTGTGVYSDWYLPSKDELNYMWDNLADSDGNGVNTGLADPNNIGNFPNNSYWSSTEYYNRVAWRQYFYFGFQIEGNKYSTYDVRAVRAF